MIRLAAFALALLALPAQAQVAIQEVTSPAGKTAWLVEEHSIPFVAIELRFRGGTTLDEPGKRGSVYLMSGLLEEGAGDMDSRAFAEAKQDIATSIDFDIYSDVLTVSAQFLTENRDASVELIRASLQEPTFEADAIERVRGQVLSWVRSRATDPDEIVGDAMRAASYPGHPYATFDGGTEDSVLALTRDDIVTAWQNAIAQDRAYISAVGDITPEEFGVLIDTILSGLPETGAPFAEEIAFSAEPGVSVIPFDTPQSVARFSQPGMEISDPDFFAAYIVNTILGGSNFDNRLYEEVRNSRGLTYGIGTWLADSDYSESLSGGFSSVNENMAEAIDVVRAEWEKMARDGVTAEELAAAKTYLTGAYPLRFDGNSNIANILTSMQMDGYAIDYPATRNDRVMAVTLEEANRVAGELFQPENLRFVVVGQPVGLEASVD